MSTIEALVRSINRDMTPQFEERLRAALADREREWLMGPAGEAGGVIGYRHGVGSE